MRGVVLGLLLSNLLFWGWRALLRTDAQEEVLLQRVNTVNESFGLVRLVSEVDVEDLIKFPALSEERPNAGVNSAEALSRNVQTCVDIGPFDDLVAAQRFIDSQSLQSAIVSEMRNIPIPGSAIFRVYLPPLESRQQAIDKLEELRGAFDDHRLSIDSFLVVRGEMENSIALGLFAEQRNALNVQQQLAELGYAVTVQPEQQYRDEAWVTAVSIAPELDSTRPWSAIDVLGADIRIIEKLCETIAHDSQFP
jgi:hypothetical protein